MFKIGEKVKWEESTSPFSYLKRTGTVINVTEDKIVVVEDLRSREKTHVLNRETTHWIVEAKWNMIV